MRFLIPEGGVSLLDAPGKPFWDPAADKALFDAIAGQFPRRGQPQADPRCPTTSTIRPSPTALVAAFDEIVRQQTAGDRRGER